MKPTPVACVHGSATLFSAPHKPACLNLALPCCTSSRSSIIIAGPRSVVDPRWTTSVVVLRVRDVGHQEVGRVFRSTGTANISGCFTDESRYNHGLTRPDFSRARVLRTSLMHFLGRKSSICFGGFKTFWYLYVDFKFRRIFTNSSPARDLILCRDVNQMRQRATLLLPAAVGTRDVVAPTVPPTARPSSPIPINQRSLFWSTVYPNY